jgi:hypothetical protein
MCLNCLLPFLTAFGLGALGALGGLGIFFRRLFRGRAALLTRSAIAIDGRTGSARQGFSDKGVGKRCADGRGCECFRSAN